MPLVTLTLNKPQSSAYKTSVLTMAAEDVRFDATYPDLVAARSDAFIIIEILWSVGRSVKIKRALLADLMTRLAAHGVDPEQVMLCFKETAWENWSFGGGRLLHA